MDQTYQATTVEIDHDGYQDLKEQLLDRRNQSEDESQKNQKQKQERRESGNNKKFVFRRGDDSVEIDDDFELEMMADKKPLKLTLRELKDRAAGDVAVKNRMHSLAQEKKRIQTTFKEFSRIAKEDPLGALEYISEKAKEADSEFEYNNYLEKLAEQAESLGKMDDKERDAFNREKKLKKAEENLSRKEREQAVVLRKQEMLSDYPQIGDSEFGQMVDAVLNNEDLLEGMETEHDVLDKVEELIQETLMQRDIISVINEINPSYSSDNDLIFTLSDQIRLNPDLDEEDIRDIIREVVTPARKKQQADDQRNRDIRTLSTKQRLAMGPQYREQGGSDFDILSQKILERKDEFRKTPITMR